uniref:Integral membrane protein n=1 Tax=Desulfovibrio sp. U5L TaxID=596152 RepID=I2PYW1_9BACT
MKKLIVLAAALTLALSAAPAFAKGKTSKKASAKKTWQCTVGGNAVMTGTVEECMRMGGMVANYPGPDKAAPMGKKGKKAMKPKKAM